MLPPLLDRPLMSPWLSPLFTCILIYSLLPPRGLARIFIFVPLVLVTTVTHLFLTTGGPLQDYITGSGALNNLFLIVDRLVLSNPERDFFKVPPSRVDDPAAKSMAMPVHWTDKLWWSAKLWMNSRGIHWSWQVKNCPSNASPTYPKWSFIVEQLNELPLRYLIIDIAKAWMHHLLGDVAPSPDFMSAQPLSSQVLIAWLYGVTAFQFLSICYACAAIAATAIGLTRPCDWPPFFGSFYDAYTVRRFWGRSWHQSMRRIVSTYGIFVARNVLQLPKGSLSSRYVQLYIGFSVTAASHIMGAFCAARYELGEIKFYLGQALAITFEDAVIAVAKRQGIQEAPWTRGLGYIWTLAWFSFSLRGYIGGIVGAGISTGGVFPALGLGKILIENMTQRFGR